MKKREMEQEITRQDQEITRQKYELESFRAVFFKELGKIGEVHAFKEVFFDKLAELFDMRMEVYEELKRIDEMKKQLAAQAINGRDKQADRNDGDNGEHK